MSPVVLTVLCCMAFILVLGWIYRRMSVAGAGDPVSEQWWQEFSPERYAPMGRLLSKDDFDFVRTLPGYRAGLEQHLRSRRIAIFSTYLLEMRRDFNRLQSVGQALLISGQCAPGLQDELFHLRVQFQRSWWQVRGELLLYRVGIGQVQPERLVQALRGTAHLFLPEASGLPSPA